MMGIINNIQGQKFGRWVAIGIKGKSKDRHILWQCRCDCGNERVISSHYLVTKQSKSCGCLKRENGIKLGLAKKHGHTINRRPTRTWSSWAAMRKRCTTITASDYHRYGGRDILVCERWRDSFENFLTDMGERPEGKTLDRINNNGNYEPENCKWSTIKEQNNNRRNCRKIKMNGIEDTISNHAKQRNINVYTVLYRMQKGYSPEIAFHK